MRLSLKEISRRKFLKDLSKAALSTAALGMPRFAAALEPHAVSLMPAKADTLILLWLAGGMAATETFDPKPRTPFRQGLPSRELLSTFNSIDTAVDNIKFSEGLSGIGSVIDRGALIRSLKFPDLGPVIHTRHQYHWHTGYIPPQTITMPHIGSWLSKTLGRVHPDLPAYIDVGQPLSDRGANELKAFMTAGFLGSEYGPFYIPDPSRAVELAAPPKGMSPERFDARYKLREKLLEAGPIAERMSEFHFDSLERSLENSYRLVRSPAVRAFDLAAEPKEVYEAYNTGKFGLGCLLARRLAEVGTRFIEVAYEYVPFGHWDTHKDGHERTAKLKESIDRPVRQLILDLESRGLLKRTLVVVASEFSRVAGRNPGKGQRDTDVLIANKGQYGLHRHFVGAGSVLLFGAGIKPGALYGSTNDLFPCDAVDGVCAIEDLHATIYKIMGIPADFNYEVEKRPVYVTKNGEGRPIEAILA